MESCHVCAAPTLMLCYLSFSPSVVIQPYNTYVQTSDVMQGNDIIMKCDVPSFVTDFVQIIGWEDEANKLYPLSSVTTQGRNRIESQMTRQLKRT